MPRHGENEDTKAAFIAKLSDAETEACETQVWIEISLRCEYINNEKAKMLNDEYNQILGQIITMIDGADKWLIN